MPFSLLYIQSCFRNIPLCDNAIKLIAEYSKDIIPHNNGNGFDLVCSTYKKVIYPNFWKCPNNFKIRNTFSGNDLFAVFTHSSESSIFRDLESYAYVWTYESLTPYQIKLSELKNFPYNVESVSFLKEPRCLLFTHREFYTKISTVYDICNKKQLIFNNVPLQNKIQDILLFGKHLFVLRYSHYIPNLKSNSYSDSVYQQIEFVIATLMNSEKSIFEFKPELHETIFSINKTNDFFSILTSKRVIIVGVNEINHTINKIITYDFPTFAKFGSEFDPRCIAFSKCGNFFVLYEYSVVSRFILCKLTHDDKFKLIDGLFHVNKEPKNKIYYPECELYTENQNIKVVFSSTMDNTNSQFFNFII
jgi:hypothetical protein